MKKKVALVALGIVGVSVVGVALILALVDVNAYRGEIESRLEAQLGRDVTLGAMGIGLFPPRFRVDSTRIAEDPEFGNNPDFVSADRLAVSVGLLPLLSGDIRIDSLELDRPRVELVRNAEGAWNFSTLGSDEAVATSSDAPASGSSVPSRFELRRFAVRDGLIAITDLGRSGERVVYDHIDLTLADFAPNRPFSFDIAANLPGEGAQHVDLSGTVGPLSLDDPLATPVSGALMLDEVGIDGLRTFLHSDSLSSTSGSLSGEATIQNDDGIVRAGGRIVLEQARFDDVNVGFPVALEFDSVADLPGRRVSIDDATILLGTTPIGLTGTIDMRPDPAGIDLQVRSDEISVEEVARMASAFGVAFPPDVEVEGRTDLDLQVTGTVSAPILAGTITGRQLRIFGQRVPLPVEVDAIDVALSPEEIRADDFEIRTGETQATARFLVTDYSSESPVIDTSLEARDATLEEIQSITRAYGVAGLDRVEGTGRVNLDVRASGPLDAVQSQSLARSLNGNLNLDFMPLRVLGFDAAGKLSSLVGFDDGSEERDYTEIITLRGNVDVIDGLARTEDLVAELTIGEVALAGTADLATETLDLRLAAVLSEAFSEQVRSRGVGNNLQSAFTNTAGELVLPVRVTGNFSDPRFAPDAEALTRMQLERALDDPSAFLDSLLGRGTNDGVSDEDPSDGENDPAEAIRGILGGLFGGGADQED